MWLLLVTDVATRQDSDDVMRRRLHWILALESASSGVLQKTLEVTPRKFLET